ncbi:sugar phosphate isomerase/epimerase family protein [Paenibacillus periandrae]|uniref:sugar phosphate isomerase/epimerase family protein n=1 Tax=Paenibacillus periandrae TaxID=1761741 RepID=UPI001F08D51E|nr:TIM barrel protein [Paenibacillus periandrae]
MTIKLGVSLYSFQEDYYLGKLDLEGCIAKAANEIGAEGIEVLPDQMPLPSYPNYTEEDIDKWLAWMDKYKTTPTSYSIGINYTMFKNRMWTVDEYLDDIVGSIKRAKQLGFKIVRNGILKKEDLEVYEKAIPAAEHYGIQLCTEIHAPRSIRSWYTQDLIEMIQRTGTKHLGFVVDFGIFNKGMPVPLKKRLIREGGNEQILNYIDEGYRNKQIPTEDEVRKMGGGNIELSFRNQTDHYIYDDPELLKEVIAYTQYCHGKFYEMDENCEDVSVDYEGPLRVLKENGFNGYIGSEYEGQRHYFEQGCDIYMDPIEQVRRHHVMMRKYLGEQSHEQVASDKNKVID